MKEAVALREVKILGDPFVNLLLLFVAAESSIPLVFVHQVNEELTRELEMVKQRLMISQTQIQELTSEKVIRTKQITDLEAERAQLIREKEELLSKVYETGQEKLTAMKDEYQQLRWALDWD